MGMSYSLPPMALELRRYSDDGTFLGSAILTFSLENEEGDWSGICLELGTVAEGDSFEEVVETLRESVLLQIRVAERSGFITEFLQDRNVQLHPGPQDHPHGWVLAGAGQP